MPRLRTYQSGEYPTPEQIREAREAAGMTQVEAAAVVHRGLAVRWSEWENGTRRMQPDTFELFLIKTGQRVVA